MEISVGLKFNCDKCPFANECEHKGISIEKACEVIDYHNTYVTLKPPMESALVFVVKRGIDEDIIPTEKEAVPQSLLDEVRDRTQEED
jgi:hypothetical protein